MMVQLHLNCQKDHLCHQLCLQRTSLEDEQNDEMFSESEESIVIEPNVMSTAHPKAFPTLKICITGMVI
jgi:hypothetical protein